MSEEEKVITIENAGYCTAYELRQELIRRDAFDFQDPDKVNFKILLQRLMVELVKDKQARDNEKATKAVEENVQKIDSAKEERERKKSEALERSKARQQNNPDYFKKRLEDNEKGKLDLEQKKKELAEVGEATTVEEEEQEEEDPFKNDDPFRSYQPNSRSKIFIR